MKAYVSKDAFLARFAGFLLYEEKSKQLLSRLCPLGKGVISETELERQMGLVFLDVCLGNPEVQKTSSPSISLKTSIFTLSEMDKVELRTYRFSMLFCCQDFLIQALPSKLFPTLSIVFMATHIRLFISMPMTALLLLASCAEKTPPVPEIQASIQRVVEYDSLIGMMYNLDYHHGYLYTIDYNQYKIFKMDTTGHVVTTTGKRGDARGEFAKTLQSISVNRDSVFVTDGARILSYDTTLQLYNVYPEPEQWYNIWDIAFDKQGRLAVAGGATSVDEEFAPNFLVHPTRWVEPTYHLNFWFFDEYYIASAGDAGTYFTYSSAPYIELFDANGTLVREWKLPYDCDDNPSYDASRSEIDQIRVMEEGAGKRAASSCIGSITTTGGGDLFLLTHQFGPTPRQDVLHYTAEGVLLRRILLPEKYRYIAYASDTTLFAVPHANPSIVHRLHIPLLKPEVGH